MQEHLGKGKSAVTCGWPGQDAQQIEQQEPLAAQAIAVQAVHGAELVHLSIPGQHWGGCCGLVPSSSHV